MWLVYPFHKTSEFNEIRVVKGEIDLYGNFVPDMFIGSHYHTKIAKEPMTIGYKGRIVVAKEDDVEKAIEMLSNYIFEKNPNKIQVVKRFDKENEGLNKNNWCSKGGMRL